MKPVDEAALEVWKVTIDVQKHFNDLGMRVRSVAITVLGAFLAAAGYALKEQQTVSFGGTQVALTGLILTSALVCWGAFYVMDRLWYHRLLKAAVVHGRQVESALMPMVPMIGLTQTIDKESPLFGIRAGHRLSAFYVAIAVLLVIAAGIAFQRETSAFILAALLCLAVGGAEWFRARKRAAKDES